MPMWTALKTEIAAIAPINNATGPETHIKAPANLGPDFIHPVDRGLRHAVGGRVTDPSGTPIDNAVKQQSTTGRRMFEDMLVPPSQSNFAAPFYSVLTLLRMLAILLRRQRAPLSVSVCAACGDDPAVQVNVVQHEAIYGLSHQSETGDDRRRRRRHADCVRQVAAHWSL